MTEQTKDVSGNSSGDERTPDKTIGEVKYAQDNAKKDGDKPEPSKREPGKQGGVGGL